MSVRALSRDRVTRVALFGVRFRDAATHAPVSDGLDVRLYRPAFPRETIQAFATRGGTLAVQRLPAMPRWDLGEGDLPYWTDAQAKARPFVVEVRDRLGRFHDFSFRVSLPLRGVFTPSARAASLSGAADSLPLLPAPGHAAPVASAVVHAQLADADADRPKPLARALLSVEHGGARVGLGMADTEGKVVVMFPYPVPLRPGAPAGGGPPPRPDLFGWDLDFRVFNGSVAPRAGAGASPLPDLDDLLAQLDVAPKRPLATLAPATGLASQRLVMGQALALKTSDSKASRLHVGL